MTPDIDPQIATALTETFAIMPMMRTMGAELTRIAPGEIEITAPLLEACQQQHGVAHAALTFALGDTAAGCAAQTMVPPGTGVMTAEMKINLLAPGTGLLVATGRVLRPGKRLIVVSADVWGDSPKGRVQVAVLQGTIVPV